MEQLKVPLFRRNNCPRKLTASSSSALVLILVSILLISLLLVGLFSISSINLRSSASFGADTDLFVLQDSCINLVEGQISDAVKSSVTNGYAWASQPGLIRTFGAASYSGTFPQANPVQAYKLYSSSNMDVSGAYDPAAQVGNEIPNNWASLPGQYTDLNAPVVETNSTTGTSTLIYPIADPNAVGRVEGFANNYSSSYPPSPSGNPLPMPVEWLYVLQSGAIVAMNSDGTLPGATPGNKPIARMAFWTDDETCKLNVNTASEGSFWDVPRADGILEQQLSVYQPTKHEYQRYPGHPATTCLSVVFPSIALPTTNAAGAQAANTNIYALTPKYTPGGSFGGIQGPDYLLAGATNGLTVSTNRLFATADEFLLAPSHIAYNNSSLVSPAEIAQDRFFITANSRAPEINLFGQPRVCIWPLDKRYFLGGTSTNYWDATDQLIAFASTLGNSTSNAKFYFQRQFSTSTTKDYTQIANNQSLYTYLQTLTATAIPGFGGNFLSKYSGTSATMKCTDRDELLTEIVDYIRSQPNLYGADSPGYVTTTSYYGYSPNVPGSSALPLGQVTPITITQNSATTRGFGRSPSLAEVAVVFSCSNIAFAGSSLTYKIQPTLLTKFFNPSPGFDPFQPGMQVSVTASTLTAGGTTLFSSNPTSIIQRGSGGLDTCPGVLSPLYFTGNFIMDPTFNVTVPSPNNPYTGTPFTAANNFPPITTFNPEGDTPGTVGISANGILTSKQANPANASGGAGMTFTFGGTLTLAVTDLYNNNLQTVTASFPTTTLPVPFQRYATSAGYSYEMTNFNAYVNRTPPVSGTGGIVASGDQIYALIQPGDVVRSVEVDTTGKSGGDWRLAALQTNLDSNWMHPPDAQGSSQSAATGTPPTTPLYTTLAARVHAINGQLDSLSAFTNAPTPLSSMPATGGYRRPGGQNQIKMVQTNDWSDYTPTSFTPAQVAAYAASPGTIPSSSYTNIYDYTPSIYGMGVRAFPANLKGAKMLNGNPGDWDNSYGAQSDGAYINPVDNPGLGPTQSAGASFLFNNFINPTWERAAYLGASASWHIGALPPSTDSGGLNDPIQSHLLYSASRQLHSAVQFGSLPSRAASLGPFETLCFSPNPAAGYANHRGWSQSPPDELLLDLFTMPTVEPYAISEPFSTAGKVNLNYQIAPFTYLERSTALRGVLKSVMITAMPPLLDTTANAGFYYKRGASGNAPPPQGAFNSRWNIDRNATIQQFDYRFSSGVNNPFVSAAQVCEMFLYPTNTFGFNIPPVNTAPTWGGGEPIDSPGSNTQIGKWWAAQTLTGDNSREQPYSVIYPRVTTQSNTYRIHMRLQMLVKTPTTVANTFVDGTDVIDGEYRGSAVIERYLDPNDPKLVSNYIAGNPLTAATPTTDPLPAYKWRVLQVQQFAP